MIRLLLTVVGIVVLVAGTRRATGGTQVPLARGDYKGAGQALLTGLAASFVGFTVTVAGLTGSVAGTVVGALIGVVGVVVGGRKRYVDIQRQVSGG